MLSGWEGSTADGSVLRDVVNRINGLKVPRGNNLNKQPLYSNLFGNFSFIKF